MAGDKWQTMRERGGVIEHRLRLAPEGSAHRYARVFEVLAWNGKPAEYQAQYGADGYIRVYGSVAEAKASLERDPRVVAFLADQQLNKGD